MLADGAEYEANFVTVALNVVRKDAQGENELPSILRGWFGPQAGQPGTRHEVVAAPASDGAWRLSPSRRDAPPEITRWTAYSREQIPPLFGDTFSEARWNAGFVVSPTKDPRNVFLLVTLEKVDLHEDFQYVDRFLAPDMFQWSSQNRTAQGSKAGQIIRDHARNHIAVHLFVRPRKKLPRSASAPFVYCGPVRFEGWEGEKPIKVRWKLEEPVPERLRAFLSVP